MNEKEKFFEDLQNGVSVEEYSKGIKNLWNIDHDYMDKAIAELNRMVAEMDLNDFEEYALTTQKAIKLESKGWAKEYYENVDKQIYPLNPESDFRTMEDKYVKDHINYYKSQKNMLKNVPDKESYLDTLVSRYDKLDKTIPFCLPVVPPLYIITAGSSATLSTYVACAYYIQGQL